MGKISNQGKLVLFFQPSQVRIVEFLKSRIEKKFRLEVRSEALEIPSNFLNERRKQYRAEDMLIFLSKKIGDDEIGIWVVGVDMYSTGTNFIFGLARPYCCAILSTARLLNNLSLIEKELLHELGHVLGLGHCGNECVMRFSNSVYEALSKNGDFCDSCKRKLGEILRY